MKYNKEETLVQIDGQIETAKLRAQHWMLLVSSGVIQQKRLQIIDPNVPRMESAEFNWVEMSPEEKNEYGMNIAERHIHRISELVEEKLKVLQKKE